MAEDDVPCGFDVESKHASGRIAYPPSQPTTVEGGTCFTYSEPAQRLGSRVHPRVAHLPSPTLKMAMAGRWRVSRSVQGTRTAIWTTTTVDSGRQAEALYRGVHKARHASKSAPS